MALNNNYRFSPMKSVGGGSEVGNHVSAVCQWIVTFYDIFHSPKETLTSECKYCVEFGLW